MYHQKKRQYIADSLFCNLKWEADEAIDMHGQLIKNQGVLKTVAILAIQCL